MSSVSNDALSRDHPRLARSFGLRWLFVYFGLYSLPFPLSLVPFVDWDGVWRTIWSPVVVAFAERVLGSSVPALPAGSGDTTYNYIEVLVFLLLATGVVAAWTLLGRRTDAGRVAEVLRVQLRFVLAIALLRYGWSKVFPIQFGPPSDERLISSYGDSSPMGLLWTLMGSSPPYRVFSGILEVVAGFLLLPRRTATLGALLAVAVMVNVLALNLCFDVPVKLYSAHLLFMAGLIALPEARRLFAAVALGRAAPAARVRELSASQRGRRAVLGVKLLAVSALLWNLGAELYAELRGEGAPAEPSIAGLWTVERFERDGAEVPLLVSEADVWRRFAVSPWGSVTLRRMDDSSVRYFAEVDEEHHTLALRVLGARHAEPWVLAWERDAPDRLRLTSVSPSLVVDLRRAQARSFLLTSRGFRWISEESFNR